MLCELSGPLHGLFIYSSVSYWQKRPIWPGSGRRGDTGILLLELSFRWDYVRVLLNMFLSMWLTKEGKGLLKAFCDVSWCSALL